MRPPACLTARIIAAMRDTPTSTRRSDEISLVMNAKPWRSRSWNSGTILMPWMPQTMASPLRISRSLRQTARASVDHDRRVHALALDLHPLAAEPHRRLVVGRRVEVLRRAAVAIGGAPGARPRRARRGSRARPAPRAPRSAPPAPSRSRASTRTTARRWCGRCGTRARRTPRRGGRRCRTSRS